jgi:hypothetical protein
MNIRTVEAELFHTARRPDRQTEETVTFRNFDKSLKKAQANEYNI